jgi:hypothetical protein
MKAKKYERLAVQGWSNPGGKSAIHCIKQFILA